MARFSPPQSWPTRPDLTCSASASTTAWTCRSRRRPRSWRQSPPERSASVSPAPSRSSRPSTRFASFRTSQRWTFCRAAARELIAGRGAYIESFALFGADMADYDALFAEKLDLLLKLNERERVTWQGRFRPPLHNAEISPQPVAKLPIWLGVGGNPESDAARWRARPARDPGKHLAAARQLRRADRGLSAASRRARTRCKAR